LATMAVLWDMDGVLVDTGWAHWQAWQRLWREEGVPFTEEQFWQTFGQRNDTIIAFVTGQPASPQRVQSLGDRKEQYYREIVRGRVRPLPGVIPLIRALQRAGVKQAVASAAPRANLELILTSLGIGDAFSALVTAEEVKRGKPDPEVFLTAALRLGVPPHRCLVIEDGIAGVQAAKAAGMVCLAVTTTHPAEKLQAADRVVTSLTDVSPEAIQTWLLATDRQDSS